MPVDATGATATSAEDTGHHQFNRVMVAVYATITLLGVIAAASWKQTAEDEVELIAIVLGASAAVSLAHLWAAIMADQLVHGRFPDRRTWLNEATVVGSFFGIAAVAVVTVAVSSAAGASFDWVINWTMAVLIGLLFAAGLMGARWSGAGWGRALLWGFLDAGVGIALLVLKLVT